MGAATPLVLLILAALLMGCALALIEQLEQRPRELRHRREHCTGLFLSWPSVGRCWLVRCDGCGRAYPATRRARSLATDDLERAQAMRALELDGLDLLHEERRALP